MLSIDTQNLSNTAQWADISLVESKLSGLVPIPSLSSPILGSSQLIKLLNIWKMLLQSVKNAMDALDTNRYLEFDPLTGNGSCHLISYRLYNILANSQTNSATRDRLDAKALKDKIQTLLQKIPDEDEISKTFAKKTKGIKFSDYLSEYDLDLYISDDALFIVLCWLLSLVKERIGHTYQTNPSRLISLGCMKEKKACRRLVKFWQQRLSVETARWFDTCLNGGDPEAGLGGIFIPSSLQKIDSQKRVCLPSFMSTCLSLLHFLIKEGNTLCIKVNLVDSSGPNHSFNLFYTTRKQKSVKLSPLTEDAIERQGNDIVWVWEGCSIHMDENTGMTEVEETLRNVNPIQLIMAHCSQYPEYPEDVEQSTSRFYNDRILETLTDMEFDQLRAQPGVSLSDSSLWCCTHVYTNSLKNQKYVSQLQPTCPLSYQAAVTA